MTNSLSKTASPRRPIARELLERLRAIVGDEGLLCDANDCWSTNATATSSKRTSPTSSCFRPPRDQVVGHRQDVQRVRRAVRAARRRHEPGRRLPAGRRRRDDRADADEADSGNQPARPLCRRRAGRGQRLAHAAPARERAITMLPIPRAKGPARSAATWPRIPAARTR